ncbi:hypothetical protein [Vibrio harveyi]|uniref:hypothetical protein n=1 Tax=Vibrio harveyi TaxID=669 RepID=UPI001F4F3B6C|nr:hypothetical protein [Vibrio harveyi]
MDLKMQETSSMPCEEVLDKSSSDDAPTQKMKVAYPRKPIFDWFLAFSTLGFYTNFWLYRRIKEIDQLSARNFKPFLWFFVPWLAIFQYFAFRSLDRTLCELEEDNKNLNVRTVYYLGALGFLLSTIYFSLTSQWATPLWLDFVAYLLTATSFTAFSYRVNNFKRQRSDIEFTGKKGGYHPLEWLVVIIMTPGVLLMYGVMYNNSVMKDSLEAYPDQSTYIEQGQDFQLTFHGANWHRLEIGTYSDGSALAEFASEEFGSYLIVFNNRELLDINEHMHERRQWIDEEIGASRCVESRSFVGNDFALKVELVCTKESGSMLASGYVTLLHSGDNSYELMGILDQPAKTYSQRKPEFAAMAKEFTLQ